MEIDGTDDDSKEVDEWGGYWGTQKYTLEEWDGTLPDGQICQHGWDNNSECSAKAEVGLPHPGVPDNYTMDYDADLWGLGAKKALVAIEENELAVAAEELERIVLDVDDDDWPIVTKYTYYCTEHADWERERRRLSKSYREYDYEKFSNAPLGGIQPLQWWDVKRIMAGEITVEEAAHEAALEEARYSIEDAATYLSDDDREHAIYILKILAEVGA